VSCLLRASLQRHRGRPICWRNRRREELSAERIIARNQRRRERYHGRHQSRSASISVNQDEPDHCGMVPCPALSHLPQVSDPATPDFGPPSTVVVVQPQLEECRVCLDPVQAALGVLAVPCSVLHELYYHSPCCARRQRHVPNAPCLRSGRRSCSATITAANRSSCATYTLPGSR
jgi:hypothetical protein